MKGINNIISHGLERLANDIEVFAEEDPDYFKFMINILRGYSE